MANWRFSLQKLYDFYLANRPPLKIFYPALFLFFVLINDLCYWWAMVTAFPELVFGYPFKYYFKVQFPVAILGAVFDSLSFFVTIYIIRQALVSKSTFNFITHLSADFFIAVLATFWVLLVFTISSWLVGLTEPELAHRDLADRQNVYSERVISAVRQPTRNLKNIYFGIIMGLSASLPTFTHLFLAIKSIFAANFKSQ